MSDEPGETTSYWCEWAWVGGPEAAPGVQVDVADGRISRVRTGVSSAPPAARVRFGLTLPGFANGHSHAFHRAVRGLGHQASGSFWTWRDSMYEVADALDPDRLHRLARATFGEMVLAGYTSVGEFHYLHHGHGGVPYADANAMGDALVAAAAEAGIRITLLDVCYLRGGTDRELETSQRRFSDGSVDGWIARASERRTADHLRLGAAVHSVRACSPSEISEVARWAGSHELPLHAHVSEQPAENEQSLAAFGRTPTQVLRDSGALGPHFTAVHATHLTADDIDLLGSSGAAVCLCPTTERDLADGIGPAARLAGAGVSLAVGSDSQAVIDALEEVRAVELDERLASGRRGAFNATDLARTLTADGHAVLGWHDAGRLAEGARADLVTVSFESVRLAGAHTGHLLEVALFGATAADVTEVTIDGVDLVVDGRHQSLDVPRELAESLRESWS
jgi:formiminoglutamate deiminase